MTEQKLIRCDGKCGRSYPEDQLIHVREGRGTGHSESFYYCIICDPDYIPDLGPLGIRPFGTGHP